MKHEGLTPGPWRVGIHIREFAVLPDGNCDLGDAIARVDTEENAEFIADAPRLAAENERLRSLLKHLSEEFAVRLRVPGERVSSDWFERRIRRIKAALSAPDMSLCDCGWRLMPNKGRAARLHAPECTFMIAVKRHDAEPCGFAGSNRCYCNPPCASPAEPRP